MTFKRWTLVFLSLLLALTMILPSCTSESSTTPNATTATTTSTSQVASSTTVTPKSGGTLRIGVANEASALGHPSMGKMSVDAFLASPAIETIRKLKPNGDLTLWLAESAVADDKALTLTITLKKGIRFHDGTDLNAKSLKWNFEKAMANKVTNVAKLKSVDIVDDYTVRCNLTEWGSDITYDVTGLYMVSQAAWEKNGDDWGKQNPVGTGPFKFLSRQTDVNIKYVKNTDYWVKGSPYLDEVDFIIIKDPTTRLASFKAGEIDVCMDPSNVQVKEIKNDTKYVVNIGKGIGGSFRLNPDGQNANSPFSKLEVRQAVAYAIDKQALVDGIMGGYATASDQQFLSDAWAYNPNLKPYTYNPEKAKELLKAAGYPDGIEISLFGLNTGNDPLVLTAIQAMLAKANIKANLDLKSAAAMTQTWAGGWNNGLGISQLPANPNMVTWLANFSWKSTRQTAKSLLNAAEIEEACTKATTSSSDLAIRQPIVWNLMDVLFVKYVQAIPLFIADGLYLTYPYVKDTGIYETPLNGDWRPEKAWINR